MILHADKGMGSGIGDLITAAWVPSVKFHATGRKAELLRLLTREIVDSPDEAVTNERGWRADLRDGHIRTRLECWMEAWGIEETPVRPEHRIPEDAMQWARREIGDNAILLFPQTRVRSRSWAASYWIDLAWRLNANHRTVIMLEHDDPQFHNTPSYYWGFGWDKVAAMMKTARCVVGLDSAPAHLAGTLGTPTLALMGPTTENVFAHCPEVRCLAGTWSCQGCNFRSPYRAACDQGCMSLLGLTPERVVEAVLQSDR